MPRRESFASAIFLHAFTEWQSITITNSIEVAVADCIAFNHSDSGSELYTLLPDTSAVDDTNSFIFGFV
jgi:hypothetical protein